MGIEAQEARQIEDEVGAAIAMWPVVAAAAGVSKGARSRLFGGMAGKLRQAAG